MYRFPPAMYRFRTAMHRFRTAMHRLTLPFFSRLLPSAGALSVLFIAGCAPGGLFLGTPGGPAVTPTYVITPSPTSLTFPTTVVGSTAPAQTVTLTNNGNQTIAFFGEQIIGTNASSFYQGNTCLNGGILPGQSCQVFVNMAPVTAGSLYATLSVNDNASGQPQIIPLTGTATAVPITASLTPTALTFAATKVGSSSAPQTVTISATGSGNVVFTGETLSGTNAGSFSITSSCGTGSVAPGQSCSVTVTFIPTAAGTQTATLTLSDNATGAPQTVTLTGTGM